VVELDGTGAEVNAVGDVVPGVGGELGVPLRLATGIPMEVVVGAALSTVLHLGEVALKEVDLVLSGRRRRVGVCVLHGEVVEDLALVDGSAGLRDQLGTEHGLAVPRRSLVVGDLDALLGAGVGGVLVRSIHVDIVFCGAGAMNVVLVRSLLVRPRPVIEERAVGVVVRTTIPHNSAGRDGANDGEESGCRDHVDFGKKRTEGLARSTRRGYSGSAYC